MKNQFGDEYFTMILTREEMTVIANMAADALKAAGDAGQETVSTIAHKIETLLVE